MDALYARYPFLDAAREAVGAADVDLADLVVSDHGAIDRGRERVERALVEGTIQTDRHVTPRVELLSYPVARVLVSLLDAPGAIEKYAAAEADTAHERLVEEFDGQTRFGDDRLTIETLIEGFDLAEAIQQTDGGYRVAVSTYLRLAPDGMHWKLVSRELADGDVWVTHAEVLELLREAVEARILAGLPFEVPAEIAEPLAPTVRALQRELASVEYPENITRVEPSRFPACVSELAERVREGDDLTAPEQFTLVTFLGALGMNAEDIRDVCACHDERFTYVTERLAGGDGNGPYPPPSFATMQDYGICEDDDHSTAHPLAEYAAQLPSSEDVASD